MAVRSRLCLLHRNTAGQRTAWHPGTSRTAPAGGPPRQRCILGVAPRGGNARAAASPMRASGGSAAGSRAPRRASAVGGITAGSRRALADNSAGRFGLGVPGDAAATVWLGGVELPVAAASKACSKDAWVLDGKAKSCQRCARKFSLFLRRCALQPAAPACARRPSRLTAPPIRPQPPLPLLWPRCVQRLLLVPPPPPAPRAAAGCPVEGGRGGGRRGADAVLQPVSRLARVTAPLRGGRRRAYVQHPAAGPGSLGKARARAQGDHHFGDAHVRRLLPAGPIAPGPSAARRQKRGCVPRPGHGHVLAGGD